MTMKLNTFISKNDREEQMILEKIADYLDQHFPSNDNLNNITKMYNQGRLYVEHPIDETENPPIRHVGIFLSAYRTFVVASCTSSANATNPHKNDYAVVLSFVDDNVSSVSAASRWFSSCMTSFEDSNEIKKLESMLSSSSVYNELEKFVQSVKYLRDAHTEPLYQMVVTTVSGDDDSKRASYVDRNFSISDVLFGGLSDELDVYKDSKLLFTDGKPTTSISLYVIPEMGILPEGDDVVDYGYMTFKDLEDKDQEEISGLVISKRLASNEILAAMNIKWPVTPNAIRIDVPIDRRIFSNDFKAALGALIDNLNIFPEFSFPDSKS